MIKNIEDLKNIQTVCRNQNQVKDYLNYLKQLGFDVEDFTNYYDCCNIVFWGKNSEKFVFSDILGENLPIEFCNKKLIKTLKKFIKQKEEQEKEKIEDFEVAEDGRVIKINNKQSKKEIFIACDWEYKEEGVEIRDLTPLYLDFIVKYGLAYATKESRDRALFKIEIETKLKNIAERLNAGRKIDWEDGTQGKYSIYYKYNYITQKLDYGCCDIFRKYQGAIYCLDKIFLNVAKQEIGENNLIEYFKD